MNTPHPIALLQTLRDDGSRHRAWINGFPADWLPSARAGSGGRAAGLETPMEGYAAIHPWFLRAGRNELRIEYRGAPEGALDYRVASIDYEAGQDLGTVFPEQELLRLQSTAADPASASGHTASGGFAWDHAAGRSWDGAPPIADTPARRESLQAAVQRFWSALDALAGLPPDAEPASRLAAESRAAIHEFIEASESRGRPFTLVEELIGIAATLQLAGDQPPELFLKARDDAFEAARRKGPQDDAPSPHPPVARRADGTLPPRLSLRTLASFDGLSMERFADGRLARLADRGGDPAIQFVSNYSDGNRGAPHPLRFLCDLWWRLDAQQQWQLAAIYPTQAARQVLPNPWPQRLFELQPY
ncbi:hypothetical protein GT347_21830 [Xylophilus rhododendri]|uniref:Uncharacterized protein n=1 Tax=Xylophilus rhododendri TaxID=2697032 RepID=A0A857J8T9_9BURK|nr:hypothetical protein [Xylophilus rhododendri]QHJ00385.1 hypothetical protein GT347_21830 [Xylophilus rhododendri]